MLKTAHRQTTSPSKTAEATVSTVIIMCPSSSMSSSAGRSDLFRQYRFITADKSQLCDGRNLESLRIFASAEPSETTNKRAENDNVKPVEDSSSGRIASVKGYRPTSRRSRTERNSKKVQPRQQDEKTVQHSQPPQEQPPIKPKANSFLPRLSFESDHTLDDSYEEFVKESQAASRDVKISNKKEGPATTRHDSRDTSTESRPDNQQRRASDSLATSSHSTGTRVTMRKLSEPMHRCSLTNASVNGIMRPARYSSINLSAMADISSPPRKSSNDTIRRCTSQLSLHTYSSTASLSRSTSTSTFLHQKHSSEVPPLQRRSSEIIKPLKPRRTMSIADMANATWSSYPTPDNEEAKEKWVASGVAFSKNMEVYVFKK